MKKNLRIVSAAAALLAVAPVAASAVSVNAADSTVSAAATNNIDFNLTGSQLLPKEGQVNVTPNITATAAVKSLNIPGSISGDVTTTFDGQTYKANLSDASKAAIWHQGSNSDNKVVNTNDLLAGNKYTVTLSSLSFNFGSVNANKEISLGVASQNVSYKVTDTKGATKTVSYGNPVTVKTNKDGVVEATNLVVTDVVPTNTQNAASVGFYNAVTGAAVQSGEITTNADAQGNLNVATVLAAIKGAYRAGQVGNHIADQNITYSTVSDLAAELKAQGISVDGNGYFKAPHSFTLNYKANATDNKMGATLPVTVTVANVADPTVPSQSKTIMHNAYYYDKDAKRVGTDKLTRYNSVTVAMSTTKIGDKTYYEVIENGKATGKFINADNIDGTKRTLKHNAYVYKTSKKRANKVVLKKGEKVTTYGGTY
ncbi:SLAP domain-containing protein, partial [Lactobacillus crispatus]